jgi:hypothetical protein
VLTILYLIALYGLGRLFEKVFRTFFPFPFTIILGLAGLIFLGGVVNLAGIAYPLVLDMMILFGLVYSGVAFFRKLDLKSSPKTIHRYLSKKNVERILPSTALIIIVFVFCAYTLSSPKAYNIGDDMEKYLSHPVRMLSTGSLSGGHLNALGSETFGGQAFLHGFIAAHWPISYVNSVDTVVGLALCLMAVFSAALRARLPAWFIPLVVAIPVFINPQIVNISASYTAAALILFLFLGIWIELQDRDTITSLWPHAVCIGLVYAALTALKISFLLLPAVHFMVLLVGFVIISRPLKDVLSWAIKVVLSASGFILPWVLLYSSHWIALFFSASRPNNFLQKQDYLRYAKPTTNLFSLDPLFYGFGASFAHYTLTIMLIGSCCLVLMAYKFQNHRSSMALTLFSISACVTPPILYAINIFIIAPKLFGSANALRYLCPVIIAAAPCAMIMIAKATSESDPGKQKKYLGIKKPIIIYAFISILLLGAFYESFSKRVKQAYTYGSILSFHKVARDQTYLTYNHYALSADAKKNIQKAQQIIPQGEAFVAWTPLAFHLDYQRNPIIDIDPAGLASPWVDFPSGQGTEEGIKYFRNLGIDYVLWQNKGYGVRSERAMSYTTSSPFDHLHFIGVKTHQFFKFLLNLTQQSQILYNDGSILILKIP